MIKDHYKILGVPTTATTNELKVAFKHLAFEHHPDRHGGNKAKESLFKDITEAYEVLSDVKARAKYDLLRSLQAQRVAPPLHQTPWTPRPTARTPFRWTPPVPKPTQPAARSSVATIDWGQLLAFGLSLLSLWATTQGGGSGNRYRGPDGRFRSF